MKGISSQLNNSWAHLTWWDPRKVANKPFPSRERALAHSAPHVARSRPRLRDRHLPATCNLQPATCNLHPRLSHISEIDRHQHQSHPQPSSPRIQNLETQPQMSPRPDPAISKQTRTASPFVLRQGIHATWGLCLCSASTLGLQLQAILGEAWEWRIPCP